MRKIINELVVKALSNNGLIGVEFKVEEPPNAALADYATNAALKAAVKYKQNPKELANRLITELKKSDMFDSVEVKGQGFINFRIADTQLEKNLSEILKKGDKYGRGGKKSGKILLEYFQPNVAKPLHLGHLRTGIIGDSLFKVLKFWGHDVESDSHLGDWGTQFGLLLYAYKNFGDEQEVKKKPIHELNRLYVDINKKIESDPGLKEKGKEEFVKLEKGDKENRKLWKKFVDWSLPELNQAYNLLELRKSDHNWGESFYEGLMPKVLKNLAAKGLLKDSQGAKIVDLEKYHLGTGLVVKSDGATTYLLRDLATFIHRKKFGFATQLYVVDSRQSHTLKQTFKILELLGEINKPAEAIHIAYGFLTLPAGAMSTRKGTVIEPKELVDKATHLTSKIIEEKNPSLKDKETATRQVALGAIKYFDLAHNRLSDIVFEWEKVLNLEGNSGPYLQYAHARVRSILRKANSKAKSMGKDHLKFPEERAVMIRLMRFSETVESAAVAYMPHYIADYLYKLAGEFNRFYQEVRVLDEKDKEVRNSRMALISAVAQVLETGLNLLGIEAPEEM